MGRWLSVDPLEKKYPFNSPYTFTANSVLVLIESEGKDYNVVFDPKSKRITIQAQFQIKTSGDAEKDAQTRSVVLDAISMYNNTTGFTVTLLEAGKEVVYEVLFDLSLVESAENGCGPVNTIAVTDSKTIQERSNGEKAGGYCDRTQIVISEDYNYTYWNVMKHEIGHSLGMAHEEGSDYLMSEEATTEEVIVDIYNVKSSLAGVGIGEERDPSILRGGEGQITRPNGPMFVDQNKMDEWQKSLENAQVEQK